MYFFVQRKLSKRLKFVFFIIYYFEDILEIYMELLFFYVQKFDLDDICIFQFLSVQNFFRYQE